MPICVRCKQNIGVVGSVFFNSKTQRCSKCEKQVKEGLVQFRTAFIKFCADGLLSDEEWKKLENGAKTLNLDWDECLAYVRGDALNFMERLLAFAASDGIITSQEEQDLYTMRSKLKIPTPLMGPLLSRIDYLKEITDIRQGKLQAIQPTIHLESGEICYLETPVEQIQVLRSTLKTISGRFIATNRKLHFLSSAGGQVIPWKNVMRVTVERSGIYLELSTKKGNGSYYVNDPLRVDATLNTLTRMAKRQMLAPQEDEESRHIPQDVKQAVWQRDQGKCVQCGEQSYLEFDHIIPFSKGGASTIGNVQLLCRRCNLQKSDRI